MKAIQLVFKAQPMIALLRNIASNNERDDLAKHCNEWLDESHKIVNKKNKKEDL